MDELNIKQQLHNIVFDFIKERAYNEIHLLSHSSQAILFQMQSSVVNANHIWGDIERTTDTAVRRLSISICINNLKTFIEAASVARELYLILPNHLIDYQDRAGKIIKLLEQAQASSE
jgi:hypothetical protein